ncbi:EamA-like transporter family protein [compost metagenome]
MWLIFAGFAAISFGLRGILYHWTSQQLLSRNVLLCGAFFMGAILSLICSMLFQQEWTLTALIGLQMGLFSFGANASMFKGFAVGKASLVAILTALPSVIVVIVAYMIWGENLNLMQLIAFIVIIAGVLLVRYSNELSWTNLQGAGWGVLAMVLFAFNDLSGKWSTMMEAQMFPTLFFMFMMGTCCFGGWWLKDRIQATEKKRNPISWSEGRTFVVGMAIGITNAVGMMLIIEAFDYGMAGLVSAVVALNVLLVLLYTRFVVKEKFTRLEVIGMSTAFAGIVIMRLFGS